MRSKKSVAKRARKVTGYVLFEDDSIVIIATVKSRNRKTANTVQIWILVRNESPIDAVKNGNDSKICFNCGMRSKDGFRGRKCYVTVAQAPQSIWHAYNRGSYPYLPVERYSEVFSNRVVRFGAYGEPVLLPLDLMQAIASVARKWTGYTHQWRRFPEYRAFLMASCDSVADRIEANNAGWRTFRVRRENQPVMSGEILCPASPEGNHKSVCEACGLCNGVRDNDPRKDIVIIVHGTGAKNFVSLDSIKAAA